MIDCVVYTKHVVLTDAVFDELECQAGCVLDRCTVEMLIVSGQEAVLINSQVASIVVRPAYAASPFPHAIGPVAKQQRVVLQGSTVVSSDIIFSGSTPGIVQCDETATVSGRVRGGSLVG